MRTLGWCIDFLAQLKEDGHASKFDSDVLEHLEAYRRLSAHHGHVERELAAVKADGKGPK